MLILIHLENLNRRLKSQLINIFPFSPVTPGRSVWEPTCKQEKSFRGRESQKTKLMKDYVKDLYKKISENIDETPELFHYDYFKLEGGELYNIDEDLKVKQESIDLLKGRLKNQIISFHKTIAKVLDKDISLAEKIQTLFREQGITIASILTAIRMAIGVLVEALLPGGVGATAASGGGEPPKDEKDLKEWTRSKLKALASLLG